MDHWVDDDSVKFSYLTKKLWSLIEKKCDNERFINLCFNDLNALDYTRITTLNSDFILLSNGLCEIIKFTDVGLVKNMCKFVVNLLQSNVTICGALSKVYEQWLLKVLKCSPKNCRDVMGALQKLSSTVQLNDVNRCLQVLIVQEKLLTKYLIPQNSQWTEVNYEATCCLESIFVNRKNSENAKQEYIYIIKNMMVNVILSPPCLNNDMQYYSKTLTSCLRILRIMIVDKLHPITSDFIGEILGLVQGFLFHGLKDYLPIKVQCLRPAAMNLPAPVHVVPKCKNLKTKPKLKKNLSEKPGPEVKDNIILETKANQKFLSDSDTSDTEITKSVCVDSKVRLEVLHLLRALVKNTQTREIFGYWPQIVATGSRNDARVLTRSIMKEPVSRVRQAILVTLTELLIDARPFLIHAEDVQHTSFNTFFGTVCLMIKELHLTLSFIISTERDSIVLTHALKCAGALIQGTPYTRLKSGLATKLIKSCKEHLFHKDPTAKVAVLSVFEALASYEPVTPEIVGILAEQHLHCNELERLCISNSSASDIGTEEEEIDIQDVNINTMSNNYTDNEIFRDNMSYIVHVCLYNISNKVINLPVRVQALKLIGRMAFNTRELVFPHIEIITTSLISTFEETESHIILHACHALEIMAECFTNSDLSNTHMSIFWNTIFEPLIAITQHTEYVLREAACDCLGTIGPMLTQLPRERTVLMITVLFSATHDGVSAVRAAGLRALGMLVTLPTLEEDTGFLMDLANTVCSACDDTNLIVRIKAAWALANLCDCLARLKNYEEAEPLPLDELLPRLYHLSVKATKDKNRVKCSAVRALGTVLYLCPQRQILKDTMLGLEALINCAIVGNDMKVRWNACHALGLVLSHDPDTILPSSWRDHVFPALCTLICHSPNFKVRTNAARALSSCNSYGKYTITLWKSIVLGFENSHHVPSYVEYPHRDTLVEQLCLTLSHVAAHTKQSELLNLWTEVQDHVAEIAAYMKQFQEIILPEKTGNLIKAKGVLEKYVKSSASLEERQIAQSLACIFERNNHYDSAETINVI